MILRSTSDTIKVFMLSLKVLTCISKLKARFLFKGRGFFEPERYIFKRYSHDFYLRAVGCTLVFFATLSALI